MEAEASSGNIFRDLGFADADERLIKSRLVGQIAQAIKRSGLSQTKAAALLGTQQPNLSRLLRGNFDNFSLFRLIECLNRLGCDCTITVAPAFAGPGKTTVDYASHSGEI